MGASAAVGVIASAAIAAVAEIIVLAVNRRGELNRLKAENERLRDAAGKLAVDAGYTLRRLHDSYFLGNWHTNRQNLLEIWRFKILVLT